LFETKNVNKPQIGILIKLSIVWNKKCKQNTRMGRTDLTAFLIKLEIFRSILAFSLFRITLNWKLCLIVISKNKPKKIQNFGSYPHSNIISERPVWVCANKKGPFTILGAIFFWWMRTSGSIMNVQMRVHHWTVITLER
jgi:hypothetical protein